jgi:hypothetical protein
MKSHSNVVCVKCGNPIESLDDLIVRGLSYNVVPLHSGCYGRVKSQWIYRLSLNVIGWSFWAYLIIMNLILVICLIVMPNSWQDLRWFFLIVNIPQLFFRLLALISYELPLKNSPPRGRS